MSENDPLSKVTSKIPFTIAMVAIFGLVAGTITLMPIGPALGVVALVFAGAAAYTTVEYHLPDLDGTDPHDRAWIVRHMTRNVAALVIVLVIVFLLRRAGVPKDVINVCTPLVLGAVACAWYKWHGSI
jgi:uncharacterized membrane protein